MTKEEMIKKLEEKSEKLRKYIESRESQQKFFEKIVCGIIEDINKTQDEIADINIQLDALYGYIWD